MMKYFDTHCHLNGAFYSTNVSDDIGVAKEQGVIKIIAPGTSYHDTLQGIVLAKKYPGMVFAAAGIHPSNASVNASAFLNHINPDDIIAFGETGLDLYHAKSNPSLDIQKACFSNHIALAKKLNKPLIIHARAAEREVYEMIKDSGCRKLIMHCYTGSAEWAHKFLQLGAYISFAGIVTYTNDLSLIDLVKNLPLERIICETDAPYLTPVPYRNLSNTPAYVVKTATHIASLRSESFSAVVGALYNNALTAFGLEDKL